MIDRYKDEQRVRRIYLSIYQDLTRPQRDVEQQLAQSATVRDLDPVAVLPALQLLERERRRRAIHAPALRTVHLHDEDCVRILVRSGGDRLARPGEVDLDLRVGLKVAAHVPGELTCEVIGYRL